MAYRIRKGLASAVYCLNATEGTISASLSRVCATAAMLGVVAAPLHPVAVGQLGHPVFLLGAEAAIEPNNHAICAATVFVVADWLDLRITHHTGHSGDFTIGIRISSTFSSNNYCWSQNASDGYTGRGR
ncbi:TPA: hypothetical protein ACRNJF_002851 [Pseudomonas aeruginosa]